MAKHAKGAIIIAAVVNFVLRLVYVECTYIFQILKSDTIYLYVSGPIVGALANKFGCRRVAMVGAVVSAVSFFVSTFSPNVTVMILLYGFCGGMSFESSSKGILKRKVICLMIIFVEFKNSSLCPAKINK